MEHCITATGPVPTRRISSELGPLHTTSTWAWRCLWRWAPASCCSRVLSRPWPSYSLLALHQVFMRVCCMLSLHYNLLPWWSCVWQWFTWQTTAARSCRATRRRASTTARRTTTRTSRRPALWGCTTPSAAAEFEGEQLDRERNGRRNGPTAAAGEMVRLRFAWAVAVRSSQLDI